MKADEALDRLVDKMLAYRPTPKGKPAKKRKEGNVKRGKK